jgi:hypothetical protein
MSVSNQSNKNTKKSPQPTKNVTLKDAIQEDNKEVEYLKKTIIDLTSQLVSTRNQLREFTGEKPSDSKSSRATEFYKNNPGLTRKEYMTGFLELGFGKAYAATMYQKVKKLNDEVAT